MRNGSSPTAVSNSDRPESFQLKGGLFPMSLLELRTADLLLVEQELQIKIQRSPSFFKGSAIVFGLEQLTDEESTNLDLVKLHSICRKLDLIPTAIRGADDQHRAAADKLGLAVLPKSKTGRAGQQTPTTSLEDYSDSESESESESEALAVTTDTVPPESSYGPTKVVTAPIRSGQQIYARGGDLIVLSSVSAGAEVLADGNIHIYGALRGRALAGINGDESARIFCSSQEAELVSIAGQFLVDEVLRNNHWKQAVQISIEDGRLKTAPLV